MMKLDLESKQQTPIQFQYPQLSREFVEQLKQDYEMIALEQQPGIILGHTYFQNGYPGTYATMFTRKAIYKRLQHIIQQIWPNYSLYIFDTFRTLQTQAYLFESMQAEIRTKHPNLTNEELAKETRKYVSHPHEPSRFKVPPHNSGGAIDLTLIDRHTNHFIDCGSAFDQTESISRTDYFEPSYQPESNFDQQRWEIARKNRRLLYHLMVEHGFTNLSSEWWHFDLGDEMWAQAHQQLPLFHSMEPQVKELSG